MSRSEELMAFLRSERRKRLLVGLAVAAAVVAILWSSLRNPPNGLAGVARLCNEAYLRSRTAAESAFVDREAPIDYPEEPKPKVTCGELRATGEIRRVRPLWR